MCEWTKVKVCICSWIRGNLSNSQFEFHCVRVDVLNCPPEPHVHENMCDSFHGDMKLLTMRFLDYFETDWFLESDVALDFFKRFVGSLCWAKQEQLDPLSKPSNARQNNGDGKVKQQKPKEKIVSGRKNESLPHLVQIHLILMINFIRNHIPIYPFLYRVKTLSWLKGWLVRFPTVTF